MPDFDLQCNVCSENFVFTEADQQNYRERKLKAPKLCRTCFARQQNEKALAEGKRARFEIICSGCGRPSSVPFKPDSGRAILCYECFNSRKVARPEKQIV